MAVTHKHTFFVDARFESRIQPMTITRLTKWPVWRVFPPRVLMMIIHRGSHITMWSVCLCRIKSRSFPINRLSRGYHLGFSILLGNCPLGQCPNVRYTEWCQSGLVQYCIIWATSLGITGSIRVGFHALSGGHSLKLEQGKTWFTSY